MKSDLQLHQEILEAIVAEPILANTNIGIAVKSGVVTLSGYCDNHGQKVVAEKAVSRIAGVRGIAEEIQVNPPNAHRITDEFVAHVVLNTLKWNTMVPADRINVKVEHGWVTLIGDVPWHYEKTEAEKAIRYLEGVRGISNKITVTPSAKIGDVQTAIKKAFERTAGDEANRIVVTTEGSIVTISGHVSSWLEYKEAERAARATPGVSDVKNELKVNLAGTSTPHIA